MLTRGTGTGRTHPLTGPEVLTAKDIAAGIATAVGRSVGVTELAPAELEASLLAGGVPGGFAADVAALCREVATGSLATTTPAVHELTGTEPRTFAAFAVDHADALCAALGRS